jgi:aldose 1-epimerase
MAGHHSDIVEIVDVRATTRAKIAPFRGFNCFSLTVGQGDQTCEVLWSEPDFATGKTRPSRSGIPLLFPFPGRIANGAFTWHGKKYVLEPNDGRGNAIHGFVYTRPWRVLERTSDRVLGEFHAAVDDPTLLAFWPGDFCLRVEYRVNAGVLDGTYHIFNPGSEPLPYGFGTHPYFRVPLGGEDAADCVVGLPVHEEWELNNLLPTGIRFPLRDYTMFHQGLQFGSMQFDSVFSGLTFDEDGLCRTWVYDPDSGRRVVQSFDKHFTCCVVYTPDHREAVCIEPYTCVPNAMRLHAAGIPSGLRILEPGASVTLRVSIGVQES